MIHSVFYALPVLITGGCGFIGSHLAEQLVTLGAQVTILDNLSSGSLDNIAHIRDHIKFINASITDKQACLEATRDIKVIFHLAALISVPESVKSPVLCHEVNVDGLFNILEAARANNVKRVVFSSSAAVYGNTEAIISETAQCNPGSPYGFTKRVGELLCQQYSTVYGLETVILRYFNVWGPRQNPNGSYAAVVAKFTDQMSHNLPITIYGDGLQTRDFIHIGSIVNANLTLGSAHVPSGEIFNIGTGKSINLLELIEHLRSQFPNYSGVINFEPSRPGDLKNSRADCTKYYTLLNHLNNTMQVASDSNITVTHNIERNVIDQ